MDKFFRRRFLNNELQKLTEIYGFEFMNLKLGYDGRMYHLYLDQYTYSCQYWLTLRVHLEQLIWCDYCGKFCHKKCSYCDPPDLEILFNNCEQVQSNGLDCCICYDKHSYFRKLPCGHHIGENCFMSLLTYGFTRCPLCRNDFY